MCCGRQHLPPEEQGDRVPHPRQAASCGADGGRYPQSVWLLEPSDIGVRLKNENDWQQARQQHRARAAQQHSKRQRVSEMASQTSRATALRSGECCDRLRSGRERGRRHVHHGPKDGCLPALGVHPSLIRPSPHRGTKEGFVGIKEEFKKGCEEKGGHFIEDPDGTWQCNTRSGIAIRCTADGTKCWIPRDDRT